MLSFSFIKTLLSHYIVNDNLPLKDHLILENVEFLCAIDCSEKEYSVFITTAETKISSWSFSENNIVFVTSDYTGGKEFFGEYIELTCSALTAFNIIYPPMRRLIDFRRNLWKEICSSKNLESSLIWISKYTEFDIFLFDGNQIFMESRVTGLSYSDDDIINFITATPIHDFTNKFSACKKPIYVNDIAKGIVVFVANKNILSIDIACVMSSFTEILSRLDSLVFTEKDNRLLDALSDLIENPGSLMSYDDIAKLSPFPLKEFYTCMVVEFENRADKVNREKAFDLLKVVFPTSNIINFKNNLVIFNTYDKRTFHIEEYIDIVAIEKILLECNAFAAISNGTRNYSMIRTNYILAHKTVVLGQKLCHNPDERFFIHEKYSMYCAIDLCARQYRSICGHDDILYLVHPTIVAITRYDVKNKTNLRDILFYYLLNDRNLTKTATAMYMHRNTIINKVNKISEILGDSLEDGQLQQRLMFSCQIVRYYEKYLKKELKL